jgi:mRNA-degrading endonuclease YafQ of YafQ-DinJ toxin-antitoxin module
LANGLPQITTITRNEKFESDFKSLPPEIQKEAKNAIRDLLKHPIPVSRRMHALHGYRNPKVFTIDVTSNHAYKISLEIDGQKANLRRIGTHKVIDRAA